MSHLVAGALDKGPRPALALLRARLLLPQLISPVAVLMIWELSVRLGWMDERLIAPPSVVVGELWLMARNGDLLAAVAVSLGRVVPGFLIGAFVGIVLGASMAHARLAEIVFDPIIEFLRPISPLALFPLFILWFGIGEWSKICLIAFACCFPVILSTYAGVRGIDVTLFRAARSLGASPRELVIGIVLRGSLPHLFTGIRLAWGIALIVIVAAEMIGASRGIGYMILESQQTFRIPRLFGSIVMLGAIGFLTDRAIRSIRRKLLPWEAGGSI